ncbi:MAG: hypothetical protein M3P08_14150 [Thermoproteota archaeon]|nr:hypothetical protein [Thermoproteota archaeon]
MKQTTTGFLLGLIVGFIAEAILKVPIPGRKGKGQSHINNKIRCDFSIRQRNR